MRITLTSRPSDVRLPPHPSRLYGRSGRAALTAGTLGTVGDHPTGEDVHRDVEVRHPDGYDPHVVSLTDHSPRPWYPCDSNCCTGNGCDCSDREALRQSRLRRWQTIR
jgi:hypothetical protein